MKVSESGASAPAKQSNLAPAWKPGQSGNPAGRYMGSRQRLTESFINDLSDFYQKEGAALIRRLADENPAALIQVIARLLPKETHIQVSGGTTLDLTVDQRARIAESWLLSQSPEFAIDGEAIKIKPDKEPERIVSSRRLK